LRLGSELPGWESLVTAYLDLALVTATSTRAVLESAVLHSIRYPYTLISAEPLIFLSHFLYLYDRYLVYTYKLCRSTVDER
jgi:hypothetical protein